jgi:hypothetical protein
MAEAIKAEISFRVNPSATRYQVFMAFRPLMAYLGDVEEVAVSLGMLDKTDMAARRISFWHDEVSQKAGARFEATVDGRFTEIRDTVSEKLEEVATGKYHWVLGPGKSIEQHLADLRSMTIYLRARSPEEDWDGPGYASLRLNWALLNAWTGLSRGAAHLVKVHGRGDIRVADELKAGADLVGWGSADESITAVSSAVHLRNGHLWVSGENEHELYMESETVPLADVVHKFAAAQDGAKVYFEDALGDYDCPLEELVGQVETTVATQDNTDEESEAPSP